MDSTSDWYCCVRSSVVCVSTENSMLPTLEHSEGGVTISLLLLEEHFRILDGKCLM